MDAIFAPVYYRLLLRFAPLTEKYGNGLINQILRGVRKKQKVPTRNRQSRPRVSSR